MPTDATVAPDTEAERWNYRPEGPVPLNPLFSWPPNPVAVWNWYRGGWLQITAVTIPLLMAAAVWWLILPPLAEMATFELGWMLRVWLANLVPDDSSGSSCSR